MPKSARIFADFFYIGRLESTLPVLVSHSARLRYHHRHIKDSYFSSYRQALFLIYKKARGFLHPRSLLVYLLAPALYPVVFVFELYLYLACRVDGVYEPDEVDGVLRLVVDLDKAHLGKHHRPSVVRVELVLVVLEYRDHAVFSEDGVVAGAPFLHLFCKHLLYLRLACGG